MVEADVRDRNVLITAVKLFNRPIHDIVRCNARLLAHLHSLWGQNRLLLVLKQDQARFPVDLLLELLVGHVLLPQR